jgi:hypothetical protein
MTETRRIPIQGGFWQSAYEPNDMPGGCIHTRYQLEPISGDAVPSNGDYRGFVPVTGLLRLVSGGEWCGGSMINQTLRDYRITFDEAYHAEYLAGFTRAYKGKRKLARRHLETKSALWREAYLNGLYWRDQYQAVA